MPNARRKVGAAAGRHVDVMFGASGWDRRISSAAFVRLGLSETQLAPGARVARGLADGMG